MKKIRARKPTALYKTPYWQNDDIQDVEKGKVYYIAKTMGIANGLTQVELGYSAGVRWVCMEDWEAVGEKTNKIPARTIQTIDNGPNCPLEAALRADRAVEDGKPQSQSNDAPRPQKRPYPPIYFTQLDNGPELAHRTCFSSSCAMLAKWYKPDSIQDDMEYLDIVNRYGDTTQVQAQLDALWSLGLKAEFNKNWSCGGLCREVSGKDSRPIVFALLHRGNYKKPTGGGHYALAYGADWNKHEIIVHDPYFADYQWIEGKYGSDKPGRSQRWHFDCLKHRFSVNGAHDGWVVFIPE